MPTRRRSRSLGIVATSAVVHALLLTLLSDVGPDDAPTRIRAGSHHDVAGVLGVEELDPFEAGLRAIVGQQISVKGAATLLGRIVARCGGVTFASSSTSSIAELTKRFMIACRPPWPQLAWAPRTRPKPASPASAAATIPTLKPRRRLIMTDSF